MDEPTMTPEELVESLRRMHHQYVEALVSFDAGGDAKSDDEPRKPKAAVP